MANESPLISIITPSYNQCNFLRENIDSIKQQSEDDIEHIVVDGGSDDGSIRLLKEKETEYNLRWVSEPDRGQSHAINKGINMATGEWIAWLNADDFYYPGALSKTRIYLNRDVDIVYGDFCFVDQHRNPLFCQYNTLPSKLSERYWTRFSGNHCTFFNQSVFNEVGGVNEELTYMMDAELFWRILTADCGFSYYHFPTFIAARRLHEDAKTVGQSGAEMAQIAEERQQIYGDCAMDSTLRLIVYSGIGLGAKTFWMGFESLHPKYELSIRRATRGMVIDYKRAITAFLSS